MVHVCLLHTQQSVTWHKFDLHSLIKERELPQLLNQYRVIRGCGLRLLQYSKQASKHMKAVSSGVLKEWGHDVKNVMVIGC